MNVPDSPAALAEKLGKSSWERYRFLDYINSKLVALEEGKAKVPRLIVNTPPQHGKSSLISFWVPIWLLARNPKRRIILISYEHDVAARWGGLVRDWIRDNGEAVGLNLDPAHLARHNWRLTSGGGMLCAGAGGPITGYSADCVIIDDPIKNSEEAASETMRDKIWDWFQTVPVTRLQKDAFIIAIGTRWHEDDLLGRLERLSRVDSSGERPGLEWDIVKLPAIAEADDLLGRQEGEPLCPERFPLEVLLDRRKGMSPYQWSAVYQQRPTPEEGAAVKRSWWKYYYNTNAPEGAIMLPRKPNGSFDFDLMIQSWDLSFKDMKKNDYCVGQVWGRKGASFFLVDQVRGHMNAKEVINQIKAFQQKYPLAIAKLIEDTANGPAIMQVFQHEVSGMIPVKVKSSKDTRLQSVIPYIAAGNVYLPHPEFCGWTLDLIEEHAVFPLGKHDDQVDALVHALRYLQPQAWLHDSISTRETKERLEATRTPIERRAEQFFKAMRPALKGKIEKRQPRSHW